MSDRIIVATFDDTNAAYETARAMKDLKKAGDRTKPVCGFFLMVQPS